MMTSNLIRMAQDYARRSVDRYGEIIPALFYRNFKGNGFLLLNQIIGVPMPSEMRRTYLQTVLGTVGADSYAMVTETWVISRKVDNPTILSAQELRQAIGLRDDQTIADLPDRQQMVMVSFHSRITRQVMVFEAAIHQHGNEIWLGRFELMEGRLGGPMIGLLDMPGDWLAP